ncbi:MAG: CotH kinase family protein [Oscillospiraceae bacterium]|nr:CotH kinase family protein [Oscillospiraceae bacterium]
MKLPKYLSLLLLFAMTITLVLVSCDSDTQQDDPPYSENGNNGNNNVPPPEPPPPANQRGQITLYGIPLVFETNSNTYYFPTANIAGGNVYAADFGYTTDDTATFTWESRIPVYGNVYRFTATINGQTRNINLMFTGLPIVQFSDIDRLQLNREHSPTAFTMIYRGENGLNIIRSDATIRLRGASSMTFSKNNFGFNLYTPDGRRNRMSLLGMREHDNRWILDAMYIDRSKMRNRVSFDIWNGFNTPLLHSQVSPDADVMLNGTRGKYVEVFLGGQFWGLYSLTETINRSQLGLLSYNADIGVQSVRYEGRSWGTANRFRGINSRPSRNNAYWSGWRQEFPSVEEVIDWEPLYAFVRFFNYSNDTVFAARVTEYIHIENFVDYIIFQMITFAYDNSGKNLHWSVYDINHSELNRIFLTPWDLDATWGDSWAFSRTPADAYWIVATADANSELWQRLITTNAGGARDLLISRWRELRTAELSFDSIWAHFQEQYALLSSTGAHARDMARWPRNGFGTLSAEMRYLENWITTRWEFVDDFIENSLDELNYFVGGHYPSRG